MDKYEIRSYHIRTGECGVCYGGKSDFYDPIGLCRHFNEHVDGFYYWTIKIFESIDLEEELREDE